MSSSAEPAVRPTRVRHTILWLTVLLYMVTYFDRVLISTAMPSIQKEFGFSIQTVGLILAAFQLSYSLSSIILAFVCSTAIGVAFGFLPARSASKLDPVDALARE